MNKIAACLGFILSCEIGMANASVVILDAVDSGILFGEGTTPSFYNPSGSASYQHIDGVTGEWIGVAYLGGSVQQGFRYQSASAYAVLDSRQPNFVVSSAVLQLDLLNSVFPAGVLSINDITSINASDLSALPIGSLARSKGDALASDFSSGVNFGTLSSGAQPDINGLFSVTLDNAGIDFINSTDGLLPFAFEFVPANISNPIGVGFRAAPKLILTGDFIGVPAPGTLVLFIAGACFLMLQRRRVMSDRSTLACCSRAEELTGCTVRAQRPG